MPPFRVKICGITSPADAAIAVVAGADAIGLNFFSGSKRYITPVNANIIVESLPPHVHKVGVFVNASEAEIRSVLATVPLDSFQLHGDEPPALLAKLCDQKVIRAFRWSPERVALIDAYLAECEQLGCLPSAILIDAFSTTEFGGTGNTVDWAAVSQWHQQRPKWPPIILAGGLTPANITEAIAIAKPAAVDTASGVERTPREKDPDLINAFVATAKQAFDQIANRPVQ